jgi:hypothetical protein
VGTMSASSLATVNSYVDSRFINASHFPPIVLVEGFTRVTYVANGVVGAPLICSFGITVSRGQEVAASYTGHTFIPRVNGSTSPAVSIDTLIDGSALYGMASPHHSSVTFQGAELQLLH